MDAFSNLVLSKVIEQTPNIKATAFRNINDIIGGFPKGRLVEIYGRSQIGKTSLAISLFPDESVALFDLSRKICTSYLSDNVVIAPPCNHNDIFIKLRDLVKEDIIIVIDDLPSLGNIDNDALRFKWLTLGFMNLQRQLIETESIVIILNQIRISPSTGKSYNPHEGCLDAAVKIKMHHAETKKDGDLVYLDIEKHFWGKENTRCTLHVSKNKVTVPSFYKSPVVIEEESFL